MHRIFGMMMNLAAIPAHVLASDNPLVLEAIAKAREWQSKHPMFQAALAEQSAEALEVRSELDARQSFKAAAALLHEAERELAAQSRQPPPTLGDLLRASRELKSSSITPPIHNATLPAVPAKPITETRSKPMSSPEKNLAIETLRGERGVTWEPEDTTAAETLTVEQIKACRSSGLSPSAYAKELSMQPPAEAPPPKPKARAAATPHDYALEQLQMRGVPITAEERSAAQSLSEADLKHCKALHLRPSQFLAQKATAAEPFKS